MKNNPEKFGFMIIGSVCSGIGAPETAWRALGWKSAFMSEIDPQACAVLRHHNPGVPLHGDFTTIQAGDYAALDVLVGGTPCQSFSVAGLRGGMADDRGNLALEYLLLADRLRPRWVVWENVPGVLSSNEGRDFGAFLGGLAELGYGFAYRSLDAQFFHVPQRRERVFVVGYLGDWRRAAAVLFEPQSLRGDSAPRRTAEENSIGAAGGGFAGRSVVKPLGAKWRGDLDNDTFFPTVSLFLNAHPSRIDGESETFIVHTAAIQYGAAVRRLTPLECLRLQGFPDDHLDVLWRGKPLADGPRYRMIGNSMAVPVMAWIGRRIEQQEKHSVGFLLA